jgi:hypothetical protein
LTTFFHSTKTAVAAWYGDFTFKGYYNFAFHLDAITSWVCHIARTLYDLACFATRVLLTPFYLAIPFLWYSAPNHFMNLLDDALACVIAATTVVVHLPVSFMRTLTSLISGYEQNTEYDNYEEDVDNYNAATTIFPK